MVVNMLELAVEKVYRRIRVEAYTPIAKPANGSVQKSKVLLKLAPITYRNNGKEHRVEAYLIKGLKGLLRHAAMECARSKGLEVCHTSDKTEDKQGNKLIPEGFHPLGSCYPQNECILHRIFGSMHVPSKIRVWANPVANIKHEEYEVSSPVNKMQVATENRIALSYGGTAIQDFRESYISGDFTFFIDITKLGEEEVQFLLESLLYVEGMGGGVNSGYGRIILRKIAVEEVKEIRRLIPNGNGYDVKYEERVRALV